MEGEDKEGGGRQRALWGLLVFTPGILDNSTSVRQHSTGQRPGTETLAVITGYHWPCFPEVPFVPPLSQITRRPAPAGENAHKIEGWPLCRVSTAF